MSFIESSSTRTLSVTLTNFTDNLDIATNPINIPKDASADSKTLSAIMELTAGKEYGLRIKSSLGMVITFDFINLSVELIGN
jgi:hypothetical protein